MKLTRQNIYQLTMSALGFISIVMTLQYYMGTLNLGKYPWVLIDSFIIVVFAIDYFYRLLAVKNKWLFFKHNVFDLLAILPTSILLGLLGLAGIHVGHTMKLVQFVRMVGILGKINRIMKTHDVIYLTYASVSVLVVTASFYSIVEKISLKQSLWWAIVTSSTVGYGDVSPTTNTGKLLSTFLMIVGIGFVGALTSTLASFFTARKINVRRVNEELGAELMQLKKLYEQELITEEEYDAKKKQLLNIK